MSISVYSTPNCPQCRMTKKILSEAAIPFIDVDLSQDAEAMAMVKELGYVAAPVVITDTAHWSGFRHEKLLDFIVKYRLNSVHEAA